MLQAPPHTAWPATSVLRPLEAHLKASATTVFALDLRSLAALRIGLALLILVDLYRRSWDLAAHYTDAGVLPREAFASSPLAQRLSLHLLVGGEAAQAALFALAGALAVLMLVGYRTRWTTALSLGLLLSLQYRNPLVLSSADVLLRIALFWAIFLPCGVRWSLDSLLRGKPARLPRSVSNLVSAAYVLQIAMVYGFAVLLKSGSDWRVDGTAVYYVLNLAQFATPLGQALAQYPDALRLLTHAVLAWEAIGPLLLLAPFWTARLRIVTILGFVSLQAGFWLTIANLGLFPWISMAVMLGLVPSPCWDRLVALRMRGAAGASLRAASHPLLRHAQSAVAGNALFRWLRARAAHGASRALPGGRFWEPGPTMRLTVACCLTYVVLQNVSGLPQLPFHLPSIVAGAGAPIGLDQKWTMFAPSVPQTSTWFVVPGTLANGQEVDVYRGGGPVAFTRPAAGAAAYLNDHWFKYLEGLDTSSAWKDRRPFYGAYLCRQWNQAHADAERLEDLEVVAVRQPIRLDGQPSPLTRETLLTYRCAG